MAARNGKADTSLSMGNARSRWHTEGDHSIHESWACVPVVDAIEAANDTRAEGAAEVDQLRKLLEEAACAMEQTGEALNSSMLDRDAAKIRKALRR